MADAADTASTLRRMVQDRAAPGADAAAPARVLGFALAQAAETLHGLPVAPGAVTAATVTRAELPERIADRSLLSLVEGPGERLGVVALSPGLFSALIELTTTGTLGAAGAAERRPTRTDAALCAGFVDCLLQQADAAAPAGDMPWEAWEGRFRHASSVEDARLLDLLLDDTRYRYYSLAFTLGGIARDMTVCFALPERPEARATPARAPAAAETWQDDLSRTLMEARAEIVAVLARLTRSVDEMMVLQAGDLLRLPDNGLSGVRIESADGRFVTGARLGQYRGYLAVRLDGAPAGAPDEQDFQPAVPAGAPPAGAGAVTDAPVPAPAAGRAAAL